MTAWVQGGYQDWLRQQEAREAADRVVEETAELGVMAGDRGLADRAADIAALALAEQLMAIRRMEDGAEKRRAVLKIVRGLVRLRRSERDCERAQREAAQAERSKEVHEHWAEGARRRGRRTDGNGREHEHEYEHKHGDVRARMAEVLGRMSDEEIAEILRKGGYMSPASAKATAGKPASRSTETEDGKQEPKPNTAFLEAWAPKRSWWTDVDEALEREELEEEEADEESDDEAAPTMSTSTSTSTITNTEDGRPIAAAGITSNAEGASGSNLPPEGGTTNGSAQPGRSDASGHKAPPTVQTEPPGRALIEA
jgi:hypothetical protein